MHSEPSSELARTDLEWTIDVDLRDLTSESGWIANGFSAQNHLSVNEFRALLFAMVADASDTRLTAGELRVKLGVSGAAITYLVDRMVGQGHLCRQVDPTDRRRVILRHTDDGKAIAHAFLSGLGARGHSAMDALADADLEAAHRVLRAFIAAMANARTTWRSADGALPENA